MCVYSMISDHHTEKWTKDNQPLVPLSPNRLTEQEIVDFRRDVGELKKLLERAKEYDKQNSQPDCELESKKKILREIAEKMGVPLELP